MTASQRIKGKAILKSLMFDQLFNSQYPISENNDIYPLRKEKRLHRIYLMQESTFVRVDKGQDWLDPIVFPAKASRRPMSISFQQNRDETPLIPFKINCIIKDIRSIDEVRLETNLQNKFIS